MTSPRDASHSVGAPSSAVELRSLSVRLGGAEVVQGISATVAEGEWVGLIGPNGAGKTTVLRAVTGLVPYAGSVRVEGNEVAGFGRARVARRVALVPQEPVIPDDTRVAEYVLLGRTPHLAPFARERQRDLEVAAAALERLDLLGLARRRLGSLSGGERQRAVLARALAQEAPVLLLDEPTAALDVGRQQQVLELVDRLRRERGLTVVSAMHDLTLAGQFAERLLLVDGGRLAAAGTPAEVLTEELVATHYGASVRIVADSELGVVVVPARALAEADV
jgi:iron complex transport system ATP-binding protein